jgi:hypothetical protein
MVAMLVVTIGIGLVHLDCFDGRILELGVRKVCCQRVPVFLSETAKLGSCGDKWLIHFRLHV